jgi:hypothetical protein
VVTPKGEEHVAKRAVLTGPAPALSDLLGPRSRRASLTVTRQSSTGSKPRTGQSCPCGSGSCRTQATDPTVSSPGGRREDRDRELTRRVRPSTDVTPPLRRTSTASAGVRARPCRASTTRDADFTSSSTAIPDGSRDLASPCSGHGFKHSAAIGECLRSGSSTAAVPGSSSISHETPVASGPNACRVNYLAPAEEVKRKSDPQLFWRDSLQPPSAKGSPSWVTEGRDARRNACPHPEADPQVVERVSGASRLVARWDQHLPRVLQGGRES